MDPCELRMASGDAAVRDLVASRERLVEFALRSTITKHDLESVEGRIAALRATAPLVAKIKDRSRSRVGVIQWLAGRIGEDIETVRRWTNAAAKGDAPPQHPAARETKSTGPGYTAEREALKLAIQMPQLAGPYFDEVGPEYYNGPLHSASARDRRGGWRGGGDGGSQLDCLGHRRVWRPGGVCPGCRAGRRTDHSGGRARRVLCEHHIGDRATSHCGAAGDGRQISPATHQSANRSRRVHAVVL